MSLVYRLKGEQPTFVHGIHDYLGEIVPFVGRVRSPLLKLPMLARCRVAGASDCPQSFWTPQFFELRSYAPATTLFRAHSCEAMPTCRLSWPSRHWVSLLPHRP